MNLSFEYYISSHYLKTGRKQGFISLVTFLSTAGIAVGVMALIIVIAVMTGFESELKNKILGIESHILVMRYGQGVSDYDAIASKIEEIDGIRSARPFIYTQVMLRSASGVSGAVLRGENLENLNKHSMAGTNPSAFNDLMVYNKNKTSASLPAMVVGKVLGEKLNVKKGDRIFMVTPVRSESGKEKMPIIKRFVVAGFFETGMNEYDGAMFYISLSDAQDVLKMHNQSTGIQVRVDDIYKAKSIAEDIIGIIGFPFWARDWMQMNKNLFSMLKLQKIVMFIILTLIVLVAAFNIASSLIMMVMEKTKDIAILKAMGATRASIKRIFVLKGIAIGVVGTLTGGVLGFVICMALRKYPFIKLPGDVYFLTTLPVTLEPMDVGTIVFSTLIICFFATLYPAAKASGLDPVEGIRAG